MEITQNEILEIAKLEKKYFKENYINSSQLIKLLDSNHHIVFLKNNKLKIISYLIFLETFDFIEIIKICTDEHYRKLGKAKNLLDLVKKKNKNIFIEVDEKNENINFYTKNNFVLINVRNKYYTNGNNALIFKWKKINQQSE